MNPNNNNLVTKNDLTEAFDKFEAKISLKFEQHDKQFEKVDQRIDKLEGTVNKLDQRIDKLEGTVEKLDKRTEKNEKAIERLTEAVSRNTSELIEIKENMVTKKEFQETLTRMANGIDYLVKKFEKSEIEMNAQTHFNTRLEKRTKKMKKHMVQQDQTLEQHEVRLTTLEMR